MAGLTGVTAIEGAAPAGGAPKGDPVPMAGVDGSGNLRTIIVTTGGIVVLNGDVAHDGVDAGNPIKIGGKANNAAPTAVANADRVDSWFTQEGQQVVCVGSGATVGDASSLSAMSIRDIANTNRILAGAQLNFNGTTWDRVRNNVDATLLASAARTATLSSSDQTNYQGKGVKVFLDVTTAGTGSITLTIEAKDPVSGQYKTLLSGAAVTTVTTNVYTVYPGITATANVSASDILPRTWRVTVTHNNANSITYSVGCSVID